jgi:hypothetical protein
VPCYIPIVSRIYSRSVLGTGKLRSYLLPPGAVGGLYGSGCFHFSKISSVCWINSWTHPSVFMSSPRAVYQIEAYSLLSGLGDMLVGLEEGADVDGLAAPEVSVDGPVEGEFEGAAVELSVSQSQSHAFGPMGGAARVQHLVLCRHDGRWWRARGRPLRNGSPSPICLPGDCRLLARMAEICAIARGGCCGMMSLPLMLTSCTRRGGSCRGH